MVFLPSIGLYDIAFSLIKACPVTTSKFDGTFLFFRIVRVSPSFAIFQSSLAFYDSFFPIESTTISHIRGIKTVLGFSRAFIVVSADFFLATVQEDA